MGKNLIKYLFPLFIFSSLQLFSQNIAINTTGAVANAAAMLDVSSTTQGILIPRMTNAQRDAIKTPAAGLLIYNTTTKIFNIYTNTGWYALAASQISTTTGATAPGSGIAINTSGSAPAACAILDITSTTKGVLLSRTTTGSIVSPPTGLLIYNTSSNRLSYYNGTAWVTPCTQLVSTTTGPGTVTATGIAINTTGAALDQSAILDITSTNKGLKIPTMTDAQRNSINPVDGLMLLSTTPAPDRIDFWNGTAWYRVEISAPAQPGAITGNATPCWNSPGETYSISSVTGATGYTWTVPSGWTITSGQGTTSINISYGSFFGSGSVCVTANNACGGGTPRCLTVTGKEPPQNPLWNCLQPSCGSDIFCGVSNTITWQSVSGATSYDFYFNDGSCGGIPTSTGSASMTWTPSCPCYFAPYICIYAINECGSSSGITLWPGCQ